MGITGTLFLTLLVLLTVFLCALTLWAWPHVAGPGARQVLGRIALLLSSQLALIATFAVFCNAYFGFYASWNELFGTSSQRFQLSARGGVAPGAEAGQLSGAPASPSASGSGETLTTDLTGLRSGITARLHIYLPKQYFSQQAPNAGFAAIVVDSTGQNGSAQLLADLAAHPPHHPVVVVVVDTLTGRPIGCTDQPGGPQGGLFWGQDLRTAIGAKYRVGLDPQSWGVYGTGADEPCAITLAVENAGRYSAAAVRGPWASAATPGTAADPAWWLRTYPAPPSRLLFADLGRPVESLLGPVRPPLQVTSATGASDATALDWLAQTLQGGARV